MMLGILFGCAFVVAVALGARLFLATEPARATPPGAPRMRPGVARRDPRAGARAIETLPDMPGIADYDPACDVLVVPVHPPAKQPPKGHWLFDTVEIDERRGTTEISVQGLPVLRVEGATDLAIGVRPDPDGDLHLDIDGAPVEAETLDVILAVQPRRGSGAKHPRRM